MSSPTRGQAPLVRRPQVTELTPPQAGNREHYRAALEGVDKFDEFSAKRLTSHPLSPTGERDKG